MNLGDTTFQIKKTSHNRSLSVSKTVGWLTQLWATPILWLRPLLLVFLIGSILTSLFIGVYEISVLQILEILGTAMGLADTQLDYATQYLLLHIRLPRICLGLIVGAGLSVSGAAIQGLFRNPLADPSLIGITSGGMLFAVGSIFFANSLLSKLNHFLGHTTIAIAAFIGSFLATILIYRLSSYKGRTSVTTMLLAGIATTAFCGALTGLMTYLSTDDQNDFHISRACRPDRIRWHGPVHGP